MPGRVTQSMMSSQLLRNLNANTYRLDHLQNQLSTGRRINKPSDDPVGISFSMRYRSELAANDQYESNVDSALSWLDYSDTMLGQAGNVFQRVRELAVKAANGANPQGAMDAVKEEIDQLNEQLFSIGNSEFNGKYVFNGQKTDIAPYTDIATANSIDTHDGTIQFEIGVGVKLGVNITGNQVFGNSADSDNAFTVMNEFQTALQSSDHDAISDLIAKIDTRMDKILLQRSDIGAKTNRIELAQDRLKDIGINLQTLQSKTEDADMAEVITNLKMEENVYQASLSAGSKIIQPSLVDFLR